MAIEKVIKIDLSITQSKIKIKDLKKDVDTLDKRTLKYRKAVQSLKLEEQKLAAAQKIRINGGKKLIQSNNSLAASNNTLSKSARKVNDSSGLANTAVQELGRGVSDSAFGIRGVANNASQLGSLFTMLVQRTGSVTKALKAMWISLMGPLGLLVAFQAVTAIIQTQWFSALLAGGKAAKDLNDINKEASEIAGGTVTEFKVLTDVLMDKTSSDEDQSKALRILKKDFKDFNTELITNSKNYKDGQKAVDDYTVSLIAQAKAEAALTLIKEKQGQILLLDEEKRLKMRNSFGSKNDEQFERRRDRAINNAKKQAKGDEDLSKENIRRINERFDAVKNLNKDEIEELKQSIEVLSNLGDIKAKILSSAPDGKKDKKTEEEQRQEKILSIQRKYLEKSQDLSEKTELEKIDRQEQRALKELDDLKATEEEKQKIIQFFIELRSANEEDSEKKKAKRLKDIEDKLIEDQVVKLEKEKEKKLLELEELEGSEQLRLDVISFYERKIAEVKKKESDRTESDEEKRRIKRERLNKIEKDAEFQLAQRTSQLLIGLGGKGEKIGKALAVANVIKSGIEGVQNAYTTAQKSPITLTNPAYPVIQAASAGAFSALQVQRILSSGSSSGRGGASSVQSQSVSAPSFNLVQGTQGNQIAGAIQSDDRPRRAYVVASDVTTAAELDRNKISQSSL